MVASFRSGWPHKGQQSLAYAFFKPTERDGNTVAGEPFKHGTNGAPLLASTPAWLECKLADSVERGDHSVFVAEVVDAGLNREVEGRTDEATLWLKELGEKTYYGG